jgi:hypothetical protein
MTQADVEPVVLDAVRRYTADESAGPRSRFQQDLRLSDAGRQMLFASLAQTFLARGVSLASHGFLLRDFLACATPADVREAVVARVFGKAVLPPRAKSAVPPAIAPAAAPPPEVPAKTSAGAKAKAPAKAPRKPAAKKGGPRAARTAAKRRR